MKKIVFLAFSFVILAACTNEVAEAPVSFARDLTFYGSREGVSPDTKTVRMGDGSTWWNASEEISVFYGSGSDGGSKFTSQNTEIQEIVEFDGSIQTSESDNSFWAVYPYSTENSCDGESVTTIIPAAQTASEGNFSGDFFPAIAKSKTQDLAFLNICGGIKFIVSRNDIKSVSFKGNGGEILAGKVQVAFSADGKPEVAEVLDGKTEVTLNATDGGTFKAGIAYYISLLPTALDGGFTMTFNTANTKGVVSSDKAQTIKRSIFGALKSIDSKVTEWESTVVEPEWVDLGLSVKWASFNLGASKPEEYGDYFAWGEIEPKEVYDWSTYKWCNGDYNKLTKYCPSNEIDSWDVSGSPDNLTQLTPEDDAANVLLGGVWRMPTRWELEELANKCTWDWTVQNGVGGELITGPNGNSIFLPPAGARDGTAPYFDGYCMVRSSSLISSNDALCFAFYGLSLFAGCSYSRCLGLPVRPVYDDRINPEPVLLSDSSLSLYVGASKKLTAIISPANTTDTGVIWSSDRTDVAIVDENKGVVVAVSAGTATITATTNVSKESATCEVTVAEAPKPQAVDLGLPSGLKWASWNVGASAPEEYGGYFAWGETSPKTDYSWASYKWCEGSSSNPLNNTLTKYNDNSSYGIVDHKTVLDLEDDVAHVYWGGSWRIPTDAEWAELVKNCTWTSTTQNGVDGCLVTSQSNGNSIFLPAASKNATQLSYTVGYYWSSSLNTDYPYGACSVEFQNGLAWGRYDGRGYGYSVRPVEGAVVPVASIEMPKKLDMIAGQTKYLSASVQPVNATYKNVTCVSSDESIATVDTDGYITAVSVGNATITAYSADASITATCEVTVVESPKREAVDLGLPSGLKWATCNIGASFPEEYGDCFAWGETEPKSEGSWSTYKWCNGNEYALTKYYTDYFFNDYWDGSIWYCRGYPDGKTVLDPRDDAAHSNL